MPFVEELLSAGEELILICMHGRAMRVLLSMLLDRPLVEMDSFKHSNLCLYVLEQQGNKVSVVLENDISHLENVL
jgi:broad specificity phosphatase PhoE